MDTIILNLPYPISVNNYYRTFRNIQTISKEGKAFKNQVKCDYYDLKPTTNNVELTILIHPKLTKKGTASKVLLDLDNTLKVILDSLIGIIYVDDKQVKKISIEYDLPIIDGGATVCVKEMD